MNLYLITKNKISLKLSSKIHYKLLLFGQDP